MPLYTVIRASEPGYPCTRPFCDEHPEVVGRDDDELDYDFDDDEDLGDEDDVEPEPKRGFGASLKRLFGR